MEGYNISICPNYSGLQSTPPTQTKNSFASPFSGQYGRLCLVQHHFVLRVRFESISFFYIINVRCKTLYKDTESVY